VWSGDSQEELLTVQERMQEEKKRQKVGRKVLAGGSPEGISATR